MASKKAILRKIQIVITTHFETPEDAFDFFDKSGNKKLSKKEIVALLKAAEISGFIRGLVSSKLIEGYDEGDDGLIDWKELDLHPTSPGYRLILNNVLFPAARKKKQKT